MDCVFKIYTFDFPPFYNILVRGKWPIGIVIFTAPNRCIILMAQAPLLFFNTNRHNRSTHISPVYPLL